MPVFSRDCSKKRNVLWRADRSCQSKRPISLFDQRFAVQFEGDKWRCRTSPLPLLPALIVGHCFGTLICGHVSKAPTPCSTLVFYFSSCPPSPFLCFFFLSRKALKVLSSLSFLPFLTRQHSTFLRFKGEKRKAGQRNRREEI